MYSKIKLNRSCRGEEKGKKERKSVGDFMVELSGAQRDSITESLTVTLGDRNTTSTDGFLLTSMVS